MLWAAAAATISKATAATLSHSLSLLFLCTTAIVDRIRLHDASWSSSMHFSEFLGYWGQVQLKASSYEECDEAFQDAGCTD